MLRKAVSGMMLALLLIGILSLAIKVQLAKAEWTGTVHIRADGSIGPQGAPITTDDNITYTLTDNITSSGDGIVVERDNIIINGAAFTVNGTLTFDSRGIYLSGRCNVTIKNMNIKDFCYGIWLENSSYNTISGCSITDNERHGLTLYNQSNNNIICGNDISNNNMCGIWSFKSSSNIIYGNNITSNQLHGIDVDPRFINGNHDIFQNIIANNKKNGITFANGRGANVYENIIAENDNGTVLTHYSDAGFYHNNFINNHNKQAVIGPEVFDVDWDNGYPLAGNYWSDYSATDEYWGPCQNTVGCDGIWDEPYILDAYNKDRYPLVNFWQPGTHDVAVDYLGASSYYVSPGENITIYVTVKNNGIFNKIFHVFVYDNRTGTFQLVWNMMNINLTSGAYTSYSFNWTAPSTTGVYAIMAEVSNDAGETNTANNTRHMNITVVPEGGGGEKDLPWSKEPDQPIDESEVNPWGENGV